MYQRTTVVHFRLGKRGCILDTIFCRILGSPWSEWWGPLFFFFSFFYGSEPFERDRLWTTWIGAFRWSGTLIRWCIIFHTIIPAWVIYCEQACNDDPKHIWHFQTIHSHHCTQVPCSQKVDVPILPSVQAFWNILVDIPNVVEIFLEGR